MEFKQRDEERYKEYLCKILEELYLTVGNIIGKDNLKEL